MFGLVMRLTQRAPPSLDSAALSMIPIIRTTTAVEIPNGMGCWKATRNSCIGRMLADRPPAERGHRGYDAEAVDHPPAIRRAT